MPLSLFFPFLFSLQAISAVGLSPAAAPGSTCQDLSFIRMSCNATLYSGLCVKSLLRHAPAINCSTTRLARAAMAVALAKDRRAVTDVAASVRSPTYTGGASDPLALAAAKDCRDLFDDAAGLMRDSIAEMRLVSNSTLERERWRVSNVQTWMSSALTNQETCTDGFADVAASTLKEGVCGKAEKLKKYTSNALALVNLFADQVAAAASRYP